MMPRRPTRWLLTVSVAAAGAVVGLPSWDGPARGEHKHAEASGVVGLDVFANGRTVDALLAIRKDGNVELTHQRSLDGGDNWAPAVALPAPPGDVYRPGRGSEPQIAGFRDRLVAVWTAPGASRFGKGPLASALSSDGGRTWRRGPSPADGDATGGQGYADLLADGAGDFYAAWLDSRDGGQGLRASVSRDAGASWGASQTIDKRTCECCWNRLASPRPGVVSVLYRDKDPRDMAVATTSDAGRSWGPVAVAGSFAWQFDGCPHVGGGLAGTDGESGPTLHALAWTGLEGRQGVYVVASKGGGSSWASPVALGDAEGRHGDLAASGGRLAAVWDLRAGPATAIQGSVSTDGGRTWSAPECLSEAAIGATHPIVVGTGDGAFLVAWTETPAGGSARWRSRRLGP